MILDARLAIVALGTVLVHAAIAIGLGSVDAPDRGRKAPQLEVVDIEPPTPPAKLPELAPVPEPAPEPAPAPEPERVVKETPRPARTTPRAETPPPPSTTPPPTGGGSGTPVYRMEGLAPGATGVPVESGPPRKGSGRGGRGGGAGSGSGSGSGAGAGSGSGTAPVSVASIKTRAKARGDFAYFDARKEYPEEARRLSVEGRIKVRLLVDARGKVTAAKLLTRLGHGLDELAMKRARLIEFDPALDTDDQPVASVVVWTFTFEIPD